MHMQIPLQIPRPEWKCGMCRSWKVRAPTFRMQIKAIFAPTSFASIQNENFVFFCVCWKCWACSRVPTNVSIRNCVCVCVCYFQFTNISSLQLFMIAFIMFIYSIFSSSLVHHSVSCELFVFFFSFFPFRWVRSAYGTKYPYPCIVPCCKQPAWFACLGISPPLLNRYFVCSPDPS